MNKLSKIYEQIKKLFRRNKKSLSSTTYNVTFESDWTSDWCNTSPIITNSSVTFNAGRVVSTHGFKNRARGSASVCSRHRQAVESTRTRARSGSGLRQGQIRPQGAPSRGAPFPAARLGAMVASKAGLGRAARSTR